MCARPASWCLDWETAWHCQERWVPRGPPQVDRVDQMPCFPAPVRAETVFCAESGSFLLRAQATPLSPGQHWREEVGRRASVWPPVPGEPRQELLAFLPCPVCSTPPGVGTHGQWTELVHLGRCRPAFSSVILDSDYQPRPPPLEAARCILGLPAFGLNSGSWQPSLGQF